MMAKQKQRFVVSWIPTSDVERACAKRGQREGDDTSFWDWIEPEDCERFRAFPNFGLALKCARDRIAEDVFAEPRIERQDRIENHDEAGRWDAWEGVERWAVQSADVDPDHYDLRDAA